MMKREGFGRNLAREGKVDVRRDEDQNVKLTQAIKLLVDAGYFRARIKGLSPFDKIVGGMTWCIEVCNFDIDVDLLFHENLTIGQKISLTEKIVQILPCMKCPYRIEPHQIQGLDSIHIYPVIEWLVTEALKTRVEYQDETRVISLNEFRRHYESGLNEVEKDKNLNRMIYLNDIKTMYGPKRRFKTNHQSSDNCGQPLPTLLEYSESLTMSWIHTDSDTESIDEEDKELKENLCEMMSKESISTRSNTDVVSRIVENQMSHITSATNEYFQKNRTTFASINILSELKLQNKNIEGEIEQKLEILQNIVIKEDKIKQEIQNIQDNISMISKEIDKKNDVKCNYNEATIDTMNLLLEDTATSKMHISSFKESCRQEAEKLKETITKFEANCEEEEESTSEILIQSYEREMEKLKKVKILVAQKTKEVESLKRIVDDVPGRAELFQYQRRFIELYNLVGAEHHETLQFFNMYNALSDSLSYMKKEHDLLNSILDNMEQGLSTGLEEYVNQLKSIISGITQNKVKLETKRQEERTQRIVLANEVHRLQDLQIYYARILHLFLQEIATNELLLEKKERIEEMK